MIVALFSYYPRFYPLIKYFNFRICSACFNTQPSAYNNIAPQRFLIIAYDQSVVPHVKERILDKNTQQMLT